MTGFFTGLVLAGVCAVLVILAFGVQDAGVAFAIGVPFGIAGTTLGMMWDANHG